MNFLIPFPAAITLALIVVFQGIQGKVLTAPPATATQEAKVTQTPETTEDDWDWSQDEWHSN